MVSWLAEFKKPFTSGKRLLIGILLSYVPIVSWLAAGYKLKCATSSMKGDYSLPAWGNWRELFVQGFISKIILLVYALPAVAMTALSYASISLGWSTQGTEWLTLEKLAALKWEIILFIVFIFFFFIFAPSAILNYAEKKKFRAAFSLDVFKIVFTKPYAKAWLAIAGYSALMFGAFFAVVIWPMSWVIDFSLYNLGLGVYIAYLMEVSLLFIVSATIWSIFGEAYAEAYWARRTAAAPPAPVREF